MLDDLCRSNAYTGASDQPHERIAGVDHADSGFGAKMLICGHETHTKVGKRNP
jgi:hypothetical protein